MRYYIGYVPGEELQNLYHQLIGELSEMFDLKRLTHNGRIPHVTLKEPFERKYVRDIECYLEEFCDKTSPTPLTYNGFGRFGKRVIFLDVKPSKAMKTTYGGFLKGMKELPDIYWGKYDTQNKHLHTTLLKGGIGKGFEEIWDYLSRINFSEDFMWDNVTIFKKKDGKTVIHRVYSLQEK